MDDGGPEPDCGHRCGDEQPGDDQVEVDSCSNVEYVKDNMPFECICQKVTPSTKHTATQTHYQNVDQPTEPNQRKPCRPERQIMKQKTQLAKNTHTIKKLEHSLNIKILQLDRLQKQRTELKSELNLRWRELTTLRATNNNVKRKLQESEAKQ